MRRGKSHRGDWRRFTEGFGTTDLRAARHCPTACGRP